MPTAADQAPITPLPAAARAARRLLFFGGMFDPPHAGHARLPALVRDRLWPGRADAWLIYIPAARSPHKPRAARAGDDDRIAMLRLAIAGLDRAAIWTDEIDRARWAAARGIDTPSYTIDTLSRAREALSPAAGGGDVGVLADRDGRATSPPEMRLLIGFDQAAAFHRWRSPRRIIALAPPVVMGRATAEASAAAGADRPATSQDADPATGLWGSDGGASPARAATGPSVATRAASPGASLRAALESTNAWTPGELDDWERRAVETPLLPFSSTAARAALASVPRDEPTLRRTLGDAVYSYIKAHNLYPPV